MILNNRILSYFSWFVALAATLGSLYFSQILKFPPCNLCWYQRIFMFPLVLMIPVGILKKDKNLPFYVLPLSLAGLAIAFYHELLQIGLITENLIPCSNGISCTTKYISLFGFVTIPLLSLMAFSFITLSMLAIWKRKNNAW